MFLEKIRVADFRLLVFLNVLMKCLCPYVLALAISISLQAESLLPLSLRSRHLACRGLQARAPSDRQIAVYLKF